MHSEWTDLLRAFENAGVDFLLVGGHALSIHGYTRATDDLDVFVRPTEENSGRVLSALVAFGAVTAGLQPTDFAREQTVFRIGQRPLRIDVLAGIDGVTYDEASLGAIETMFAGVRCRVIGYSGLLANKRASGRKKDLADVLWLEANRPARGETTD